ncbi:MAG: transposase [Spirosomataceae bacterium]
MRKSRFNESQRRAILDSYLKGAKTVEALCEEHQISPATFYKWKNEAETEQHEDKRRLKELEQENLRLKDVRRAATQARGGQRGGGVPKKKNSSSKGGTDGSCTG